MAFCERGGMEETMKNCVPGTWTERVQREGREGGTRGVGRRPEICDGLETKGGTHVKEEEGGGSVEHYRWAPR